MASIPIQHVQHHLREHLDRVKAGEVVYITEGEKVIAEIHPVASRGKGARPAGLARGEFVVPDDFDAPLPEEVLKAFEGE